MRTALETRRGRRTIPGKRPNVGGLIKFTPPVYTQSKASSIHAHKAVTSYAANQPLAILSDKADENGCIRALKVISIGKNRLARLSARHPSFSNRLVPIEPSDPHLGIAAHLRVTPGTRKYLPPSPHVDVGESTLLPLEALRDYKGSRNGREALSLTPESYVRLVEIWSGSEVARKSRGSHADDGRWGAALTALLISLVLFWVACIALFLLDHWRVRQGQGYRRL